MDMSRVLKLLLNRWWIVALTVIVFAACMNYWTDHFLLPVYEATTSLYVGKNANEQGVSAAALSIGTSVLLDYQEILKSRAVAATVIEELGLEDLTIEELISRTSISQKPETRIIYITYEDIDPNKTMVITNKIAEVFMKKIVEIMQVENVQVIDPAEVPSSPSGPNKFANVMMAVFVGLIFSVGGIFLKAYFDKTVKTPEDIKATVGLPVIGTIPAFQINRKGH